MADKRITAVAAVFLGIGVGSLLDLLGRRTYELFRQELERPQWSPEDAFAEATRLLEQTRVDVGRETVAV